MDIKGFEKYQIYDDGRVFSKRSNRFLKSRHGGCNGYLTYCLRTDDGKQVNQYAHRLVALHYVENTNPEMYSIVDHIDRNKMNNNKDNLRWADQSINRANCAAYSNTGHKNIHRQSQHGGKYEYWLVYIRRKDKLHFKTFNCKEHKIYKAIKWRDDVLATLDY